MFDAGISSQELGHETGVSSKGPLFTHTPHLSIDKISFVFDLPDHLKGMCLSSMIALEKQENGSYQEYGINWGPRGDYKTAIQVLMPGKPVSPWKKDFVLLQAGPRKQSMKGFVRVEFNPNCTGNEGLARLHEICEAGVLGISLHKCLAAATVTRLDLAADIFGPKLDNYLFEAPHKRVRALYTWLGNLTTEYLGKKGSNFVCIYDKGAQLKSSENAWLRIEARLKPQLPYSQLAKLKSPFSRIQVFDVLASGLPLKAPVLRHLLDSAQKRGLRNALRFWSSTDRKPMNDAIRHSVPEWWLPEDLWTQWPAALKAALGPYT